MVEAEVLDALAGALDAASASLRQRLALLAAPPQRPPRDAVSKARAIHGGLGPRQGQILNELEKAGEAGTNTGVISRAIGYSQPNVHLTLAGLMRLGFVEKDSSAKPQLYSLAPKLR